MPIPLLKFEILPRLKTRIREFLIKKDNPTIFKM
jgi:hypothetical protein